MAAQARAMSIERDGAPERVGNPCALGDSLKQQPPSTCLVRQRRITFDALRCIRRRHSAVFVTTCCGRGASAAALRAQ